MKLSFILTLLPLLAAAYGQEALQVVERGPHHRLVQAVSVDAEGNAVTNSWTEVASGLHYQSAREWIDANPQVRIYPGGAICDTAQHQVIFNPELNVQGAVDLLMADGKRLITTPMGISFFDASTGKSVLLASVTNSLGELLPSGHEIIYRSAFDGLDADVLYVNSIGGFEQNILFRSQIPDPSEWGLNPQTTRLEVLSEFFSPPEAAVKQGDLVSGDSTLEDQSLDFGPMQMASGKAFDLAGESAVLVAKQWTVMDQRQFLIESVDYNSIKPQIEKLPIATASLNRAARSLARQGRHAPPIQLAQARKFPLRLAANPLPNRGFVMDWSTVTTASNFVWKGDTTYYISAPLTTSGTNSTFQAGTVIKFAKTNSPKLTITSPITWEGTPYRPVVLTGIDDDSAGEVITGSTGNVLTNYYADTALNFDAVTANTNFTIQNVRVVGARTAVAFNGKLGHVISHAQLVNCQNGFSLTTAELKLRNALLNNVLTNFIGGAGSTGRCEHLTVDTATWLNYNLSALTLTNALLIGISNPGTCISNSVYGEAAGSTAFARVGSGSHYLAQNSSYRNLGTTNINSSLANDLKQLTTHAPVIYSNDVSLATTWYPQAPRDVDLPDIGYHYDPIDIAVSGVVVTNTTLTLMGGVAVAYFGNPGIVLNNGSKFVSGGSPRAMNRLIRYTTVQEQPTVWGTNATINALFSISGTMTTAPEIRLGFTDVSFLANSVSKRRFIYNLGTANTIVFRDSSLRGGYVYAFGNSSTVPITVAFTNSVIQCGYVEVYTAYEGVQFFVTHYLFNNLFQGGTYRLDYNNSYSPVDIRDNFFDAVTTSIAIEDGANYPLPATTNAFKSTTAFGSGNKTLTVSDYVAGPLGAYYYPTNGAIGGLTNLVDAGSRYATNAGLYQYATQISLAKEAGSKVDIGFHYVATDASGVPLDGDSDGIPDYMEDTNGNGVYNSSADISDWINYTSSYGLGASSPGLQVFTPLK